MIRGHLRIVVLTLLKKQEMTGYQLMKEIKECIGSKPSPGSIYPLLELLHKKKLVKVRKKGRKKLYLLSKKGNNKLLEINKKKKEIMGKVQEGINVLESISNGEEYIFIKSLLEEWEAEKLPLRRLNPELFELREALLLFIKETNQKKIKKIKKILKNASKELKKIHNEKEKRDN
ncbi:hypothetical protein GF327_05905 [Candidatus Woesearchaeota archaeon]|nr:hypothetical protein [Candidatus Woesearchaeota archaeon]